MPRNGNTPTRKDVADLAGFKKKHGRECAIAGGWIGREDLLDFADDVAGQPPLIVADATRLREEVGYRPRYSLDEAIGEILDSAQTSCCAGCVRKS